MSPSTQPESRVERATRVARGVRLRALQLTIEKYGCYLSQALSQAGGVALAQQLTCVIRGVITIESHTAVGGLGTEVAETMA